MAQGDSPVGICNGALVALGEDLISSISPPDATKAARLCSVRYDVIRRQVLRATPWSCAKQLAVLSASPTAPSFGWGFSYTVPADFLRLWSAGDGPDADAWDWESDRYDLIGNTILTNYAGPLNVVYVRDLQDCTVMDSLLAQIISLTLAEDIAIALTGSTQKKQEMSSAIDRLLPDARLVTSQESSPQELDEDVWLRARNA